MSAQIHERRTPDEALFDLMAGNERYNRGSWELRDYSAARAAAVEEHVPLAAILGCADARVAAELIFDRGPGDLFMVRVAGNFLSDTGWPSIEYAVACWRYPCCWSRHTRCGALSTAVKIVPGRSHLGRLPYLIDAISRRYTSPWKGPGRSAADVRRRSVRRQVPRLTTISTVINEAEADGTTRVSTRVYKLETDRVLLLDSASPASHAGIDRVRRPSPRR